MDELIEQSKYIINNNKNLIPHIRNWIGNGGHYLENPDGYQSVKISIDEILKYCIITSEDLIAYHGTRKIINNDDLTEHPLSVTRCASSASWFSKSDEYIHQIIIPKNTKCLYIGDFDERELEIILPGGKWKYGNIVDGKCRCVNDSEKYKLYGACNYNDNIIPMRQLIYHPIN